MGRGFLQRAPPIPFQVRRADDVPEEAAPFHERALDIAGAERFVRHSVTAGRVRDQLADDFRSAGAVMDGHSHFQIARMIGATVNPLAREYRAVRRAARLLRQSGGPRGCSPDRKRDRRSDTFHLRARRRWPGLRRPGRRKRECRVVSVFRPPSRDQVGATHRRGIRDHRGEIVL